MLEPGPQGVAHGPPGGTPPQVGLQARRLPEGGALGAVHRDRHLGRHPLRVAAGEHPDLPHPRTALAQGGHAADASDDCRTGVGPGASEIFEAALGPGPTGRHRRTNVLVSYWMRIPLIARAMTSRWISEVPSKIV